VLDATYLGFVFRASAKAFLARIHHSPVAGEDVVGLPAEQERVGAPEYLDQERLGLVVEERNRPSAALEAAAAIFVRTAKSLHHPVEGDVRDGGQLHGPVPSACFHRRKLDRAAPPISSVGIPVRARDRLSLQVEAAGRFDVLSGDPWVRRDAYRPP